MYIVGGLGILVVNKVLTTKVYLFTTYNATGSSKAGGNMGSASGARIAARRGVPKASGAAKGNAASGGASTKGSGGSNGIKGSVKSIKGSIISNIGSTNSTITSNISSTVSTMSPSTSAGGNNGAGAKH